MAQQKAARVTLLHVVETIEYEDDEIKSFYDTLEKKAWSKMEALAQRLADADIPTEQQVLFGRRGNSIVQYAVDHDIDLIILTSHKVDLDQPPRGWATLSYQVSILCPCPVLLVK